ncbi:DMT family transporter [Allopusillimonas ginsengisoli]|uniref:DMT family transporter n=1 Tax=Allopusillimonas ginsengisoli TaxID=453575 RepID=UPI001020A89E|nr:DMT family transporter [Allopusillimonas ginsengisoli]TEA79556.1 EamA family transporter [Allopusillimonas ginsengisoli]
MKAGEIDRGAMLLMMLTVVLWAFSWIEMKRLSTLIGAFDLVMVRYMIAFVVLLGLMLVSGRKPKLPPLWLTLGVAVFQTTAFQCLCQLALISGGAGHVVMLAYTMPFWVVVFAWLLLGDRPTRLHVVGFLFAGLGLVGIIAPWKGLGSMSGSLLALTGGISWGLGAVLAKMMFKRHSPDVLNVAVWQMLLGAILTWPFTLIFPQTPIVWGAELYWGLAYMGILASAVGWWLWLSVVQRVSATVAGMSSLGVPVLAVVFAWLILGERATNWELAGIVMIMAGLVIVTLAGAHKASGARS